MPIPSRSAFVALALSLGLGTASFSGIAAAQTASATNEAQAPRPAGTFAGALLAARSAERSADYDIAVRYLREAIGFAEADDTADLEQSLLRALVLSGRFDDAVEVATGLNGGEGVEIDPQNLILLTLVTDALSSREYTRATQFLDVAGVNDLETLVVDGLLAFAQTGLGENAEALAAVDGLDADGRAEWVRFYARYLRGMIAELGGDAEAARTAYRSVVEDSSTGSQLVETYARATVALASSEARGGDMDAALAALDQAQRLVGGDASFQAVRERIDKGETVAPHVESVADAAGEFLYGLGMALSGARTGDLARNYLQFARVLSADPALSLIGLARLEELDGRAREAIALYDAVDDGSPFADTAALQRGLNLADLERLDEAVDVLTAVREGNPDDLRVILSLGNTLALAERWDEAEALYGGVIDGLETPRTGDWVLFYRRAIARERQGNWPVAEADFLQALDLRPEHPPVLNYLGYSWIDMNMNLDRALGMIEKAVALQPNSGAFVDSLGWAHYRLGNYTEAVTQLERALELETSDPVIHDHLGDAYWRVGREREARYQWGHALKMDLEAEDRKRIRRKLTEGLEPVADAGASDTTDDRG